MNKKKRILNWYMMVMALALGLGYLIGTAFADDNTYLNFRGGVGHSRSEDVSFFSVSIDDYWSKHGFKRVELGTWITDKEGESSAFYGSAGIGAMEGERNGFNMTVYLGLAVISRGDSMLSAHVNFTEEFTIGYDRFSVGIKHISNAGLQLPNIGRDFLFLNYRMEF